MNYQWFIGIDVSKKMLDITVLNNGEQQFYLQIENTARAIKSFLKGLLRDQKIQPPSCIFCLEHTGIYNNHFLSVMEEMNLSVCLESSVHIKQSGGLQRGKNDKVDSHRIALYAFKNKEFITLWQPERAEIKALKRLCAIRERLLSVKVQLSVPLKEDSSFINRAEKNQAISCCKQTLKGVEADLLVTENQIQEVIEGDEHLKRLFTIVKSVPGVGKVVATEVIVNSNEFKKINEARKFACYCGVAPFEHTSGSSVRGRTRTCKKANLKTKSLLHMAAMVATQYCPEIKAFYQRKVEEGKNKMNVLNAIRNKIIHRIFACVNQNRLYEKNYQNCLV